MKMKQLGTTGALLMLAIVVVGCNTKRSECETLVRSMRGLGRKLAVAQRETSNASVNAQSVASALRLFAKEATNTGEMLAASPFTNPELKRIASDASGAALSLADSATRMVDAAGRMKEIDATRGTVRAQRTLAEVAESNIRRQCASNVKECAALSKVLLSRPALSDGLDAPESAGTLSERITAWVVELMAVKLTDPELKHQVDNLSQTSRSFASALLTLSAANLAAKDLATATKSFDTQLDSAKAALTAAQDFCMSN